ncbi:DNA-directed RNA polymerase subunit alpha [Mesoaciditoga lauensis]|uniref:DNA-directed RNA polymerase subunit alpha n=1 Tax=Mesoaciditoga lauensis TaxID=1495039 RepID=UPI000561E33F|nr:DNA-directed RNA polymerase subunit alpha [Mesoaciditoga lauensis]
MLNYVKPERFIIEEEKEERGYLYARYAVQPLERGYSIMLGNSLRRVLLSSIPSVAVTKVKIKDVYHEYDTLVGVKEDVLQILLNIKQLQIKAVSPIKDEPITLVAQKKGPGILKAKDIICPMEVKIANPELKIATLNEDADVYMELFAEIGKGYLPISEMDLGNDIQILPIDGIFSPVVKVNFRTEDFRVGKKTDYDRLILEIWTKKSITPNEALKKAIEIMIEHFDFLDKNFPGEIQAVELSGSEESVKEEVKEEKEEAKEESEQKAASEEKDSAYSIYDKMKIDELELSVRSLNCLKRDKIETVGDLLRRTEKDLLRIRNFGNKSLKEVDEKLRAFGLKLKAE